MKNVESKKVLITGAAMGMGKLYAQLAVQEKAATVVLWDINDTALAETVAELTAAGGNVVPYIVDVSNQQAIEEAAARVRADVGDIDVLFNNAGVVRGNAYFWETDNNKDTAFTMKINALAPMFIAREFLPGMIAADGECRVINISSAAGLTANPRMASYCGSKWAAVGWSDSVRLELEQAGHSHVKVTTVCPYYISTGMFDGAKSAPLLPILEPEAVVGEVWKQMKKGAPFVIMPKTVLLSEAFKGLLPTGVRDFVAGRVLGVYKTMEDFTGRPTH
ncbi:SDR family oxidoreductase [Hoyosella rhizosphaerae]|uniref:Short chain dehydrogenase/reductase n=1 Tax=Hoyosella rhizosphaerae TaxID=1755582 RepID=A0A916U9Q2_9ACTN|nr:SDR family oxidoreductase [Hoyosella rhizosphaerae]MBN4926081.1 SDR family oxidoreductase [Hoyosella rhizosphaerae]GGC65726.1 putative short chain dehydrogenase/reductase [Hoyosella rhizosphaerae]